MDEAVFEWPAKERFQRLIDSAKTQQGVWSLGDDEGLAVSETSTGVSCFSLWPTQELAQACALGDWLGNQAVWIPFNELAQEWLPQLDELGFMMSVFPTPAGEGVELSGSELLKALA